MAKGKSKRIRVKSDIQLMTKGVKSDMQILSKGIDKVVPTIIQMNKALKK